MLSALSAMGPHVLVLPKIVFVCDTINSTKAEIAYNSQVQHKELIKIHCN